jgi:hypothetical protein
VSTLPRVKRASILAAALALVVLAPQADAKKKHRAPCSARHSTTLLQTKKARVYSVPRLGGDTAYACLFKKRKAYRLGFTSECQNETQATDYRLAGRYVGYVTTSCELVSGTSDVVVRDLTTGHVKWAGQAAAGTQTGPEDPSTDVRDLAMKPDGSVVWMGRYDANSSGQNQDNQVWKLEPGAPSGGTLVDGGTDVAPDSLALSNSTPASGLTAFYWMRAGVTKSGTLH